MIKKDMIKKRYLYKILAVLTVSLLVSGCEPKEVTATEEDSEAQTVSEDVIEEDLSDPVIQEISMCAGGGSEEIFDDVFYDTHSRVVGEWISESGYYYFRVDDLYKDRYEWEWQTFSDRYGSAFFFGWLDQTISLSSSDPLEDAFEFRGFDGTGDLSTYLVIAKDNEYIRLANFGTEENMYKYTRNDIACEDYRVIKLYAGGVIKSLPEYDFDLDALTETMITLLSEERLYDTYKGSAEATVLSDGNIELDIKIAGYSEENHYKVVVDAKGNANNS